MEEHALHWDAEERAERPQLLDSSYRRVSNSNKIRFSSGDAYGGGWE